MAVRYKIVREEYDANSSTGSDSVLDVDLDSATGAVNFLIFKDTTNGKKYKLQVTNGAIEVVEVT